MEAECSHSCDVLQRTFLCAPVFPHTSKNVATLNYRAAVSQERGQAPIWTAEGCKTALELVQVQRHPPALRITNILDIRSNVTSSSAVSLAVALMLAVSSLQRWMGVCVPSPE